MYVTLRSSWLRGGLLRLSRRWVLPVVGAITMTLLPSTPAPVAAAVVTSADGSRAFAPATVRVVTPGTAADVLVTLHPDRRRQTMVGFGASLTESSAVALRALPATQRTALLTELFSPTDGLGLTLLRQPLGGSEFVAGSHFTYDDIPTGERDFALDRFTLGRDGTTVLPLVRQARQISGRLTVIGTPWSAPAWMKAGDSLIGGRLRTGAAYEQAYVDYLVRTVGAYRDAGVPLDFLTLQNEPMYSPPDYPGMPMTAWQQIRLINALAPALTAQGLPTRLLGYDHNWRTGDDMVRTLLASSAAEHLAGLAFHCYAGRPSDMRAFADTTPMLMVTECSGSAAAGDSAAQRFSDTLGWHARNLVIDSIAAGSSTVVTWNLALDEDNGPHRGGCSTCSGVVTVDTRTAAVTRNAEYYTLGHLSRYVDPGAVRFDTDRSGRDTVTAVAFDNPDGQRVVVLYSQDSRTRTVNLQDGGRTLQVTVPARSLVTVTIP